MNPITDEGILVIHGNQPIIEIKYDEQQQAFFALNRDRNPDRGRGEWNRSRISNNGYLIERKQLTPELTKILIEDICSYFHNNQVVDKLIEFGIVKLNKNK